MSAIELIDTGLIYRNPKPHMRSIHTWHPSLVVLDSGRILAGFDLAEAVAAMNYRTVTATSDDEGKTWSEPRELFEDEVELPYATTHTVRLSRTKDGTVLAFGGRFHRADPEEGISNPDEGFGSVPVDLIWLQSQDGGQTWDGPRTIDSPIDSPAYEICHRIVELQDGTWLAPTSTYPAWNGEARAGMKAIALVSKDRGKSWPSYVTLHDDWESGVIHFEQSVDQLPDGRLIGVAWAYVAKTGKTLGTPYVLSDDAAHFSAQRPTGLQGQTAKITCLPDGRVLCLYRRDDKPGLWANLSRIDGDEWVNLAEAPMWLGAESGMDKNTSIDESLRTLKFGFPSAVVLPNGDVFAAFWCMEDCVHNIRWLRIRIGESV